MPRKAPSLQKKRYRAEKASWILEIHFKYFPAAHGTLLVLWPAKITAMKNDQPTGQVKSLGFLIDQYWSQDSCGNLSFSTAQDYECQSWHFHEQHLLPEHFTQHYSSSTDRAGLLGHSLELLSHIWYLEKFPLLAVPSDVGAPFCPYRSFFFWLRTWDNKKKKLYCSYLSKRKFRRERKHSSSHILLW